MFSQRIRRGGGSVKIPAQAELERGTLEFDLSRASPLSVLSSQFSVLSSQFSVLSSQFSVLSSAEGCVTPILEFLFLPAALLEQDCAGGGHGTFGDGNGCKSAIRVHVQRNRQPIGQGDLKQPESKKIYDGRGDRIARAIEG